MVMPTPTETGRGAWTRRGFLLDRSTYKVGCSAPLDSVNSQDQWAVSCAVEGIRKLLAYEGYKVDHVGKTGVFGPRTKAKVKEFKEAEGFKKINGIVGVGTSKALLRGLVADVEKDFEIPDRLLWGIIGAETAWDIGAVGYTTPYDVGICQFNLQYNTEYPNETYMNPIFAVTETGKRLKARFREYRDLGATTTVAWNAAVLSHNSPVNARRYALSGQFPSEQAEGYVNAVKRAAAVR